MTRLSEKYQLGARIGGGGMAEVFAGIVSGTQGFARPIAIKRMLPALSTDVDFGGMFINEARLAALLHHPNIVAILDFDRDESGSYFLVMELVQGVDLRRLMSSGRLPHGVIAVIVADILRGLAYAHELERDGRPLGIVHRDISPHNVMVSWEGGIKLVDFGIAKAVASTGASRSGSLKGKVGYMSPEQAHGVTLDGRSDLFAVGVMMHEMLTGTRLFSGATEPEVLARLLTQPIAEPSQLDPAVPRDLAAVAMRLLERDRDRRFPGARAALEALLSGPSVTARGSLDLQDLLRQRFPAEAPQRRDDSQPGFSLAMASPAASPETSPTPLSFGAASSPTRTASAPGQTPTSAGERAATATATRAGVSPALWIIGAALLLFAGVVTLVAVSGGSGGGEQASSPSLDASSPVVPVAAADAGGGGVASPVDQPADPVPAPSSGRHARRTHRDKVAHSDPKPPQAVDAGIVPSRPLAIAVADAAPPPIPPPGKLTVTIDPWARIFVDGEDRGIAPTTLSLSAGAHTVRLSNPELGNEETVTVVIGSGKTESLRRSWK